MVKAIMFDLDDTLISDAESVAKAFQATCQLAFDRCRVDPKRLEDRVRYHARDLFKSYDTYAYTKDIGISPFEGLWADFNDEGYWPNQLKQLAPDYRRMAWLNGLKDFIVSDETLAEELAQTFWQKRREMPVVFSDTFTVLDQLKGKYQLLMLTNGSPDLQKTKLRMTPELASYFDAIVISGAFGKGKPDSTIFHYALSQLNVTPSDALMVGDNPNTDIRGARHTGIRSAWINHGRDVTNQEVQATYEIHSLTELLKHID